MKTYRLAVVGLGRMGSTIDAEVEGYPAITLPYSIPAAARALPNVELVAGCDIIKSKRQDFAERWGIPPEHTYEDYRDMVRAEKPDLVAICTPGRWHALMTYHCAEDGVPMIYCEKVMACCLRSADPKDKGADDVKAIVEAKHVAFNSGVLRRFDPRYHYARKLIREGSLGQVQALVHYASATLMHGHVHSIDTLLMLLGDARVKAVRGELLPRDLTIGKRSDKDPLALYRLEFEGGVEATTVPAGNWEFEVFGDKGVLRSMNNNIDWSLRQRQPLGKKFHTFAPVELPRVPPRSATVACLQDLIDAHEQKRPTLNNVDIAHHATEVCMAIAESHRQGGKRLTLPLPPEARDLYVYHF